MIPSLLEPDADLDPLAALHAACFAQAWDATALRALLATPGTFAWRTDDGFVLARSAADEAEILTLAVAPVARGRGIGRALVASAATEAQTRGAQALFLEVAVANGAACALYAALGFAQVGRRKAYYDRSEDALVLRSALPLSPLGKTAHTG